ncbi:hypothetical protein ACFLYS_03255 [Chloroflexota bacterium]
MNWFQRHLNKTWLLIHWVIIVGFAILLMISVFISETIYSETTYNNTFWSMTIVGIVLSFGISIWVLKRKAQSMWNLFFIIIPFGVIFFLLLENKRNIYGVQKETGKLCKYCGSDFIDTHGTCIQCGHKLENQQVYEDDAVTINKVIRNG